MRSSHRNGQKNGASNRRARTPAPSARRPGTRSQVSRSVPRRRRGCRPTWEDRRRPSGRAPAARSSAERRLRRRKGLRACLRHGGVSGVSRYTVPHRRARRPRPASGLCCAIKEVSRMPQRTITLEPYRGQWPPDDADAGFRQLVSEYSAIDPMPTLESWAAARGFRSARWSRSSSRATAPRGARRSSTRARSSCARWTRSCGRRRTPGRTRPGSTRTVPLPAIVSWLRVPLEDPSWRPGA